MVRSPCCEKLSVKRGVWSAEEDTKILAFVSKHGSGNWTSITKKAGLKRCGKSCRLRWTNYLRPDLKHDNFTPQEEELIIKLHAAIGSRWSIIAQQLPGRTDNDVKNYWNTKLKKKLSQMGIDPVTHKPFSKLIADYGNIGGNSHYRSSTNRINNGSINKDFKNIAILSKSEPNQTLPQGLIKTNNSQPKESPASSPTKLEPNENNFRNPSIVTTTTIMPCPTMSGQLNRSDKITMSCHTSIVTGATNCIDIENYETIPSSSIFGEGCLSTSSSPSNSSASSTATQEALPAPFSWNDFLLEDAFAPNNNADYYNHDEQQEVVAGFLSKDLVNHIENVTRQSWNKKEVIRSQQGTSISSDFQFSPSSSSEISFVEAMLDQENEMFLSFPHLMEEPPNF